LRTRFRVNKKNFKGPYRKGVKSNQRLRQKRDERRPFCLVPWWGMKGNGEYSETVHTNGRKRELATGGVAAS